MIIKDCFWFRTGISYEDVEANMYNYDFKDKWQASQLNTADNWRAGTYRKDDRYPNHRGGGEAVRLNNYVAFGETDSGEPHQPNSRNLKVGY